MILTNKLDLPQPFVDAATNDHEYTEGRYSVTELLGGTCEAILKRRHADDIEEDVSDLVWAILGTAVHEILRQAEASESQIQENWLSVKLEGLASGYELSGIFDLYDDSTGTVTDYKNAGTIKWQKQDFEDYRMQTLLYCWLLQQIGFAAWNGEIVMILRDWSKGKAKFDKDYPQFQSTRPHGARPRGRTLPWFAMNVSIHAPARGATCDALAHALVVCKFQSTRPHGARLGHR